MQNSTNTSLTERFQKASLFLSSLVMLIGFLVLLGWLLDIATLKSISPQWISMKTNTALCFLLIGFSVFLQNPLIKWPVNLAYKKTLSVSAAVVVGLIAILTLIEYLFRINLGIDELIFKEDVSALGTLHSGRMAQVTVICFLLLGVSNILFNYKIFKFRILQFAILLVGIFSIVGLAGYIFGAEEMYSTGGFNSIAFHSVVCFFLLTIATLFARPQEGLMKLVSSGTIGGKQIRKTFHFAVVLLFLLGWLHLRGEQLGIYDSRFGIGILIISFIIIFAIVLFTTAYSLTEFEGELLVKTTELQNSLKEISAYKYALDQSSIVSINDHEGKIKFVNENFCKISKFSRAELIGQNSSIINSGYHTEEFFNTLWSTISSGKVWRNDIKSKAKDGTYFWTDTTIVPFMNEEGKPYQYVAIRNDITQRKNTEKALLHSEMKFHTLFDSTNDAVMMLNDNGFFDCNPATLKIFGCSSKEEFCSKRPVDLSPPVQPDGTDSMQLANQRIATAMEKGSNNFEWIHKRADTAEVFPAEVLLSRMELNGQKVLQATVRDITERKKAEFEKEKLLTALSDKYNELMQFNYIVSHNLRSPIANLLGLVNVINMPSIDEEEKPKIIKYIQSAALKLDEMVKDLNIILATRSPLNAKKEKVSILNLINRISDTLENQISESNCVINTEISAEANEVFTIKSYMESILYNLISNAIKYKSPQRNPQITISAKKMSDNILLIVSDNGRGIDLKQHEENIFGLYKRFHPEIEGKGLGLHMTKAQVEVLGGKIAVESVPGKGTTFTITLPT